MRLPRGQISQLKVTWLGTSTKLLEPFISSCVYVCVCAYSHTRARALTIYDTEEIRNTTSLGTWRPWTSQHTMLRVATTTPASSTTSGAVSARVNTEKFNKGRFWGRCRPCTGRATAWTKELYKISGGNGSYEGTVRGMQCGRWSFFKAFL